MSAFLAVAPKMRGLNIVRSMPATLRERDDVIDGAAHWVTGWKSKVDRLAAQLANVVVALEDAGTIHGAASWVNVRLALVVLSVVARRSCSASPRAVDRFGMKHARKLLSAVFAFFCDRGARTRSDSAFMGRNRALARQRTALPAIASNKRLAAVGACRLDQGHAKVPACMLTSGEPTDWTLPGVLALGCIRAFARTVIEAVDGLGLVGLATVLAGRNQGRDRRGFGLHLATIDAGASRRAALLRVVLGFEHCATNNAGRVPCTTHATIISDGATRSHCDTCDHRGDKGYRISTSYVIETAGVALFTRGQSKTAFS